MVFLTRRRKKYTTIPLIFPLKFSAGCCKNVLLHQILLAGNAPCWLDFFPVVKPIFPGIANPISSVSKKAAARLPPVSGTRQIRGILCAKAGVLRLSFWPKPLGWPHGCQRCSLYGCLTSVCSETSTSVGTRRPAVRLATIGTTLVVWCCTRSDGNLAIEKVPAYLRARRQQLSGCRLERWRARGSWVVQKPAGPPRCKDPSVGKSDSGPGAACDCRGKEALVADHDGAMARVQQVSSRNETGHPRRAAHAARAALKTLRPKCRLRRLLDGRIPNAVLVPYAYHFDSWTGS